MAFSLRSGGRGTRRSSRSPVDLTGVERPSVEKAAAVQDDPAGVPGALAFDLRYATPDGVSAPSDRRMTDLRAARPVRDRRHPGLRARRPGRRAWSRRYAAHLALTDLFALSWAAIGVHMVHLTAVSERAAGEPVYLPFLLMTLGLLALWLVGLTVSGSRDVRVIGHGPLEYKRVANATLAVFGAVAIASYLFKLELPRSYMLIMMPAGLAALLTSRFIWRRWLHGRRDAGEDMAKVLAVGNAATVRDLIRDLRRAPRAGYEIVGACVRHQPGVPEVDGVDTGFIDGVPILGNLDEVADVVRSSGVDTVAITSTASFGAAAVRRLSWELEDSDADLILAPALTDIAGPRIHTQPVAGLPLIHVDRPTYRGANRFLKKSFDMVGTSLLILLASPVLLGVALAVKFSSPGPVFFLQERVGINGSRFRMIKFRSMVVDAEDRLAALKNEDRDAGNAVLFKIKNDPRITGVGRFIRRFSLDELPQLFNVLKGDMSLVGPRPPLSAEVEMYEIEARRRLLVKPGITGLWQVSGRSDLTWDESVRLDVYYVENWSITADLVILWKTAKATVSSAGAY
ncbi:sugar transferase [Nakamurella flavida]|uniref:Sugar transferase n=1 Tax=Nakamurella flavida TaxID=363630 RepID=A0A938YKI8_9ACTN|nr:sugar transferase [Nakamurella flavida]MBM9476859.1 sugar transferase [Nakamurella flavida]MDP9779803.1 exopolysaccharide biosynthesis polyprenyl glycosylphosphotransferase [Nakamurella flavida]